MDPRYKNKAMTGMVIWFITLVLNIAIPAVCGRIPHSQTDSWFRLATIFWLLCVIIQYVAFFWGGSQLARAKGYSRTERIEDT
jgi:hypothetical protein